MANIVLLSEKYTPDIGGLAISAGRFAHLLVGAGHQVRVIAPSQSLPAGEEFNLENEGVKVLRFGTHRRIDDTLADWFDRVTDHHHNNGADLLHAFFLPQAGFVATFTGAYLGLPSVVSARGNDLDRAIFDPSRATHILYTLQHANAVTTNASSLARKAQALVSGIQVHIIPNGIDTQHFHPLPRSAVLDQQLDLKSLPVIGFVGELREKKGLKQLLDAYAQLAKTTHSHLLIVGGVRPGDDQSHINAFLEENPGLTIKVTGFVSPADLPAYYALMDIIALPSLRDGLPNALLEGMACQRAIVATPVGGIGDVLQDGENGVLVPRGDSKALAKTLEELLIDEKRREQLGRAARKTVMEKYTPKAELAANLDVYRQIGLDL